MGKVEPSPTSSRIRAPVLTPIPGIEVRTLARGCASSISSICLAAWARWASSPAKVVASCGSTSSAARVPGTVTVSFNAEYTKETANSLTMFSSLLIVGCIAYLVIKYLTASQKKRATEKQLELELNHYSNMAEKNRDMRVFRHDFKNNLTSVRALISDGQYGEAEKYIDELYGRLDATKSAFSTGNHFADAILAEKSAAAAIWQTKLDFDGIIPADGIENIDLCTILANALDNAVEASNLVANAVISVHAVQDSAVFMLTVSNPTLHPVEIKNNTVKTTKLDSMNHGFGIGSIRSAAKKYNGEVNLKYENGYFTVEVMMIMRKGARNDEQ